ncbi:Pectinesterase inhibitor 12 [Cardamine amara subsp. amara]|uniref:Pectinesterase inhibitor 12 n=1 Tax=Cardamine amara subsp. amara TaxID=228776 RepID=A0ABD1BGV3_CARAN
MKFVALFVIFSLLLIGFSAAQTLIQDFCKKAIVTHRELKYDFCVSSLQQDPQSKSATSLIGLLIASTNVAAVKTTNVIGIVNQVIKEKKYGKVIEGTLYSCLPVFNDATDELKLTLASVKSHDHEDVNWHLSKALISTEDCDLEFKQMELQNPIRNETNVLYNKILIPFALSDMLW